MKKSNYVYLYDNDFISLLNLIKILIKDRIIPTNIKQTNYEPNLFEQTLKIEIPNNSQIVEEFSKTTTLNIINSTYKLYLSNYKDKELLIFYFLIYSFKYQSKIFCMRNINVISVALKTIKYVEHEIHKFKGFLRFKELKGNILYAEIAPENDILFFIAQHFAERLKNEYWIIEDKKRNVLAIYDKNKFYLSSTNDFYILEKELSETEEDVEELWKNFYKTIAIKERTNNRCRMNFMPKKYWKYIIEMSDEIEKGN